MTSYRLYLAGPESVLELRVQGVSHLDLMTVDEDGQCWIGHDIVFAPDRFIAMVGEEYFVDSRDVADAEASGARPATHPERVHPEDRPSSQ
jgi:hypothetical protein